MQLYLAADKILFNYISEGYIYLHKISTNTLLIKKSDTHG